MEISTNQKFIHTTPRKLRLVADMVRKLTPNRALEVLEFTQKDAALDLAKAIKTVIANAKQKGLDEANLNFKSVEINEGPKLKRFRAGSRGRAKPYQKKMAHIRIILTDEEKVKSQNEKVKAEKVEKEAK